MNGKLKPARENIEYANKKLKIAWDYLSIALNDLDGVDTEQYWRVDSLMRMLTNTRVHTEDVLEEMSAPKKEQTDGLVWIVTRNPTYKPDDQSQGEYLYYCPKCKEMQRKPSKYCPDCGVKFEWNP